MKAEQSLSGLIRQLKPVKRFSWRSPQLRSASQAAAFHRAAYLQRRTPLIHRYQEPASSIQTRYHSTATAPTPSQVPAPPTEIEEEDETEEIPKYDLTFTCRPCGHRSAHRISKQGYHHGTVLVRCPSCKNQHLFADHLKIFADNSITIEDLMRERGGMVQRGSIEGDMEFWDDGSQHKRGRA